VHSQTLRGCSRDRESVVGRRQMGEKSRRLPKGLDPNGQRATVRVPLSRGAKKSSWIWGCHQLSLMGSSIPFIFNSSEELTEFNISFYSCIFWVKYVSR